jgi:hypothetical protein
MDRATAQQVWQALQLTPDELITQRLQLLDAYTKQDSATQHARAARSEAAKAKVKLKELQDTRWLHPAVYGAGVALLGVTGLWVYERKKRLAAQRSAAQWQVPGALPESVPLPLPDAPPESALMEQPPALAPAEAAIFNPLATSISQEDVRSYVAPVEPSPPAFQRPDPWWTRWRRKSAAAPAHWSASAALPVLVAPEIPVAIPGFEAASIPVLTASPVAAPASTSSPWIAADSHNSIAFDDSQADELGMEAPNEDFYASDIGTLQSYNPMRSKLSDVEEGMEQLLEIRMAVLAMVDLGQLPAAKKLLDNHIEDLPHTSAWAYLEHLDLCSQMGQRDAFEDMRKRYRLQFNRLAPYWKEADSEVQTLDSYTRPMVELCAVWHSPQQARTLIATWLLGAQYARRQFQLPAYNDLLDLYDMLEGMGELPPSPASAPAGAEDFTPSTHVYL